jgi:hypothetical protein
LRVGAEHVVEELPAFRVVEAGNARASGLRLRGIDHALDVRGGNLGAGLRRGPAQILDVLLTVAPAAVVAYGAVRWGREQRPGFADDRPERDGAHWTIR